MLMLIQWNIRGYMLGEAKQELVNVQYLYRQYCGISTNCLADVTHDSLEQMGVFKIGMTV